MLGGAFLIPLMSDNIERALGRIEGKLDSLVKTVETTDANHLTRLNDHSKRIGVLENWKSKMLGVAAAGSVVAGIVAKVFL